MRSYTYHLTKAYGRTQYWPMPEFVGTLRREIIVTLSNLKLYQSSGSLNSRRVRIFLAEKGLKPTPISVDLGKGELRSRMASCLLRQARPA